MVHAAHHSKVLYKELHVVPQLTKAAMEQAFAALSGHRNDRSIS
jgi:hypothetical protein